MSANIDVANTLLTKAKELVDGGHGSSNPFFGLAKAAVWTSMAATCALTELAIAQKNQAKALDRIADVINQGRSWH